jgi:hypothetical protein
MKISFLLSALFGVVAGGALGCYQGAEMGESLRSVEPISAGFAVSDFAARQFHYADAEHARQAALLEISVREQLRTVAHDSVSDGGLALAYVRLAMVEEAAGNKEAERHAMEQARAWSPRPRQGQDPSDERLRELLNKMDEYGRSVPSEPKVKSHND